MSKWLEFEIKHYEELDSTQLEARRRIVEHGDAIAGQVICADLQTAAYGKYKREWKFAKGDLAFSAILKPSSQEHVAQLCYVAALAVEATLNSLSSTLSIQFKWVNDVLVDNRKISGIIIEKVEHDFIILGIGINLLPKGEGAPHSISLSEINVKSEARQLAVILAQKLQYFYNLWIEKGFPPIRTHWLYSAKGLNKNIVISSSKGSRHGIFIDLDEEGNLLLMEGSTINAVNLGEVFFDAPSH